MFMKLLHSAIIGAIVAGVLLLFLPSLRTGNSDTLTPVLPSLQENPVSFNNAVRRASPAVVNVYNRVTDNTNPNNPYVQSKLELGAGVIMNDQGYILTNQHVIDNADQIIVALQDGRVFEAQLIGSDKLTDLAVLKIQAANLPVITINPKHVAHIGDVVLAIGNPYNLGQTITQGIIGATGRNGLTPSRRQNFLQTDASINRGNSGGALVNSLGELVGISTLSLDKSKDGETPEGLGFAIPTALATKVMEKLIRDGRVIRGYIGIEGQEIIPSTAQGNIGGEKLKGIMVGDISPGGPADQAGILPGDVILSVEGKPSASAIEVMDQIAEIRPGTRIPVDVLRNGQLLSLEIEVAEYPVH